MGVQKNATHTVGEALVEELAARGVQHVFGIPGVHTVELYRGLGNSDLRHITPRHEQGAGFMADGYARVSGRPGVAFVITGPGLTNTLTSMAQARADSVPMLVVSGVNESGSLGHGMGHLHELPDQHALAKLVALRSEHVAAPQQLTPALDQAFAPIAGAALSRPGPTHVQIPLDVAGIAAKEDSGQESILTDEQGRGSVSPVDLAALMQRLTAAERPVILAGGGARFCADQLRQLAEYLGAPVVQTVNARGVMFDHPLSVPASPSLASVRALIGAADLVLALGTELGPTDYDMYATGVMPQMPGLIRVDLCADQLARHRAELAIHGDVAVVLSAVLAEWKLDAHSPSEWGTGMAEQTRAAAWEEIGESYRAQVTVLNALRAAVPGAIVVGDSAQPIYAGNLYYDHDRPGGWFNAATGYGALGYGIPAAIGAAVAAPETPVICITGDGGAQFSLPEIMTAVDEALPITFIVWNNHGYQEIARSMQDVGVPVVGCDPTPPDFAATARSFGISHRAVSADPQEVADAVRAAASEAGPRMIEITTPKFLPTLATKD
ncbi:5-guanidino-2-oxopentanoate decarboxylase [Phaeobacter gallaeciensis]|uniref:Acetolactate synthase isozyme 1 large subunit n=1 Tax=Phaeobacter gallaeciensis TaxID=60890 RepID=A0AAD0EDC7_9RHOB|nr:5-guanidino-2-oxopentanoate decarboxylase [Phaeobacter gallaeciensis]AHD11659.1 Thiamine pyrophosphate-requiring enzyme [Phaeobacter gallaeciensis DSM 26640]ATE94923.1 putative acetolactate synthase isozyme 1 large subunit [Phaeobacter gallaeciensis]ATE99194.1 putative acetolactate synthase isozyme 1 large subunit [Phaeobacter gallaeciensis]ATF03587.1 putative acetolactate synthase isozyme 1 large subunit [Phaeobacter gallaeciensis]ATF07967.1 putative acetolactate synthase isozyme 1 large s